MTQEEKQLLLKDLCARLPYGVKCRFEIDIDKYKTMEFSREETNGLLVDFDEIYCYWLNEGFILPYLRPMSSMTEEEAKDFATLQTDFYSDGWLYPIAAVNMVNWLNSHHFDFRGLIPMGLALEAPENMYKMS